MMNIKRRIYKSGKYIEINSNAELVKRGKHTSLVRLSNGDVIKRKNRDVEA